LQVALDAHERDHSTSSPQWVRVLRLLVVKEREKKEKKQKALHAQKSKLDAVCKELVKREKREKLHYILH